MATDEKRREDADFSAAVTLVGRLFEAADGGRSIAVGEFEASTIVALLEGYSFREAVLATYSALPLEGPI